MSPGRTEQHQLIAFGLALRIHQVLPPTHRGGTAWAWTLGRDEFIPDLMVYDAATAAAGSGARFTGRPELVVEVLSSNRGDYLVWKSAKYAAAGLPRYWVVDPRDERLTAYVLLDGIFTPTARHDRGEVADLDLGVARVRLDIDALLG